MSAPPAPGPRIASGDRSAQLVCHMGVLSGRHGRNSLEAIRECFDAGVGRIEIDIHSLDGPDYIVSHDRRLEASTTGTGSIGQATPDAVRALRFTANAASRPPLLSEIVELARGCATEVQLDWKDWRLISNDRLRALIDTVAPVRDRVIVSSGQDWNLRRLHEAEPLVPFGFDPGHYLDHAVEGSPIFLPRTMGGYGYRDDHPLAIGRPESTPDYLAARMEALALQAPGAREYFLSFRMVLQMLDDGFDVAGWLHARGIGANVWTPDHDGPGSVRDLTRLVEAGIDRITTNTAPAWQQAFAAP
jgi:glycerophosphoryl diester phosphodiesterase